MLKVKFVKVFFEFLRFFICGGINTVATFICYSALLIIFPYLIAYSLSYALGIIVAYVLNARFVFKKKFEWSNFIRFPFVYIIQYIFGLLMLWFLVDLVGLDRQYSILLVIVFSIPLTFILSRIVFLRRFVGRIS